MRIHLLAVGTRMPAWVEAGYAEYAKRLPPDLKLTLKEIPLLRRGGTAQLQRELAQEGAHLQAAIPAGCHVVSLEVEGELWSTAELARQLQRWLSDGRDICLLIGGPDGLPTAIRNLARQRWSLSALTFPHALVRVLVAEQLYRAWSLLRGHPYHREA